MTFSSLKVYFTSFFRSHASPTLVILLMNGLRKCWHRVASKKYWFSQIASKLALVHDRILLAHASTWQKAYEVDCATNKASWVGWYYLQKGRGQSWRETQQLLHSTCMGWRRRRGELTTAVVSDTSATSMYSIEPKSELSKGERVVG